MKPATVTMRWAGNDKGGSKMERENGIVPEKCTRKQGKNKKVCY